MIHRIALALLLSAVSGLAVYAGTSTEHVATVNAAAGSSVAAVASPVDGGGVATTAGTALYASQSSATLTGVLRYTLE